VGFESVSAGECPDLARVGRFVEQEDVAPAEAEYDQSLSA
jgi:hypothetical protein